MDYRLKFTFLIGAGLWLALASGCATTGGGNDPTPPGTNLDKSTPHDAPQSAPPPVRASPPSTPIPVQSVQQPKLYTVLFDADSSALTKDALRIVRAATDTIRANPASQVSVVGYSDTSQDNATSMAISEARAKALADALIANGVPSGQISVAWKGESDLAVPTVDGVSEPLNRRATIFLTY